MREKDVFNIFKECGGWQEGHFLLSSGLHSKSYLQAALVLQFPDKAQILCEELAKKFKDKKVDVVIGPALGGIVISYQLSQIIGARSIFAERFDGKMVLRRDFKIKPQEKVLIVEDVITTGGSVRELISLVKENNATILGIAAIVDRTATNAKFENYNVISLLKLDIRSYGPQDCPLCQKGLPLTKPGSRKR